MAEQTNQSIVWEVGEIRNVQKIFDVVFQRARSMGTVGSTIVLLDPFLVSSSVTVEVMTVDQSATDLINR